MLEVEWRPLAGKFRLKKGGIYVFLTEQEIMQVMAAFRKKGKDDAKS